MGYQELIASLRKEAEENVRSIQEEADAEVKRLREEASGKIKGLQARYEEIREKSIKEIQEKIISEARYRARQIRLQAEHALSERLYSLASGSIKMLREKDYEEVFFMLVKELPDLQCKEIRVHPEDMGITRKYFSDTEIIPDETITGGFEAVRKDGRMIVINTFNKRLEKAWDMILPLIIKDIYKEVLNAKPSDNS